MLAGRDGDMIIRIHDGLYLNTRLIESVSVPKEGTLRITMLSGAEWDMKMATKADVDDMVQEIRRFPSGRG